MIELKKVSSPNVFKFKSEYYAARFLLGNKWTKPEVRKLLVEGSHFGWVSNSTKIHTAKRPEPRVTRKEKQYTKLANSKFKNEALLLQRIIQRNNFKQAQLGDIINDSHKSNSQYVSNVIRGTCGLPLKAWAALINKQLVTLVEILDARSKDLENELNKLTTKNEVEK